MHSPRKPQTLALWEGVHSQASSPQKLAFRGFPGVPFGSKSHCTLCMSTSTCPHHFSPSLPALSAPPKEANGPHFSASRSASGRPKPRAPILGRRAQVRSVPISPSMASSVTPITPVSPSMASSVTPWQTAASPLHPKVRWELPCTRPEAYTAHEHVCVHVYPHSQCCGAVLMNPAPSLSFFVSWSHETFKNAGFLTAQQLQHGTAGSRCPEVTPHRNVTGSLSHLGSLVHSC